MVWVSGLGCGDQSRAAGLCSRGGLESVFGEASGGAAGGESVVTGRVGEPVRLGVTTGIGMTVMGTEGGDRADGMGVGRDSMWSSSALETLLMWIVEFTLGWLCSFRCCRRSFSFSSSVGKTQPLIQPIPSIHTHTQKCSNNPLSFLNLLALTVLIDFGSM